ncbi:snare binding protein sec1 [Moniliophthora roreri MCA 2997]|uniref:Snare binding protein sec1 n=2 Tax=Moniliophthora roreri TaxID=221103 RepID=V2XF55_MONRO|nr:snare binding protein sec1 [Moniliophthora roreri MCA 2997]KAI3602659.1 snare binding protein sec1 [Moniliophthora roreri]
MSSLINIVRSKFLEVIRSVNPPGKWKILVVDEHSQKILGSVLKQFDILEENVTQIESISNYRDPQPEFEALYLLMPTSQNVDRIIRDFGGEGPQYAGAHLFFIEGLSEPLFQRLTASSAEPYLRGLKELFLNFRASEAQTFSLDLPEHFFSIYSPPRSENAYTQARGRLEEDLQFASKLISNVCITLNEFPYIRYYVPVNHPPLGPLTPHASTRPPPPQEGSGRWRTNLARGAEARAFESVESDYVTKLLAFMVQNNLEEHKKSNPDFGASYSLFFISQYHVSYIMNVQKESRQRATLIITDRSMDMVAPFLHEFTYQAMANDLLPIQDGTKYTYKFQSSLGSYEDKTATLSESDRVWTEVRHMHMREAIDKLMADFNKFLEENAVFKGDGAANLNDMKEMLANLPQYQEQRENFSLHLSMAQECMGIFEKEKLPLVANVEQNCATGVTAEGKSPKHLVEEMVPLLDSRDVINVNKVRMVALYIQYREGVPDEDRRRLYQHARLSLAEQDAVNALTQFGVRISRTSGDKDMKKKLKQKPADDDYELSRYKPLLKTVIEDHAAGKLDTALFPYVKEAPSATPSAASLRAAPAQPTSLRSQKPAWHRAARPGANTEQRPRLLVFVAGGMTYSEIREAYQLSNALSKDIYIGSSHTLTPRHFVDDLKVLTLAGVGSRVTPNGLREFRGQRPFQEFYDDRYYTKDGPRPQPKAPPASQKSTISLNSFKAPRMEHADSYSSSTSTTPSLKEEKKKKKGLFSRF